MDYSVEQAANILGVSARTIRNWIKKGRFPNAYKLDPQSKKSSYKIPKIDVDSFLRERQDESL